MKHIYLVDFENVSDAGLEGFFRLNAQDTVYLFYSSKSNRINIDFIEKLLAGKGAATLNFVSVSAGNQALDLQLASFLGSLLVSETEDCSYTIVSRDKGFGCLRTFWQSRSAGVAIAQVGRIADHISEEPAERAPLPVAKAPAAPVAVHEKQPEAEARKPIAETPAPVPAPIPAPAPAPVPAPVAAEPAPKPEKPTPSEKKEPVPPQPVPGKASSGKKEPEGLSKPALNSAVQQALSKAKFDSVISNSVASLVSKSYGDKKIRQTVYRELIKSYGQKKGLEIYNQIKGLL